MKHDIREISYSFQKERADKDLIYKIDVLLTQTIEDRFIEDLRIDKNFNKTYYGILKSRDEIIGLVVEKLLKEECENEYKIFYLVSEEFTKVLNKVKRNYNEEEKIKEKLEKQKEEVKEERLLKALDYYFNYCFTNAKNKTTKEILTIMSSSQFRQATLDDFEVKKSDYKDFDKIYNKALNQFKTIHKYDLEQQVETEEQIGLGWKIYFVIKALEGLFKL